MDNGVHFIKEKRVYRIRMFIIFKDRLKKELFILFTYGYGWNMKYVEG